MYFFCLVFNLFLVIEKPKCNSSKSLICKLIINICYGINCVAGCVLIHVLLAAGVWCDASRAAGTVLRGALATKANSWDIECHLCWEVARASAGSTAVPHEYIWAHSVENTGSGYS